MMFPGLIFQFIQTWMKGNLQDPPLHFRDSQPWYLFPVPRHFSILFKSIEFRTQWPQPPCGRWSALWQWDLATLQRRSLDEHGILLFLQGWEGWLPRLKDSPELCSKSLVLVVVVVVVAGACSNKYQSVAADVCIFPTVQHPQSCFANRRYCPHFRSWYLMIDTHCFVGFARNYLSNSLTIHAFLNARVIHKWYPLVI